MWGTNHKNLQQRGGFSTPPPTWKSRRLSPMRPASEKKMTSLQEIKADLFHVIHKVPAGDSPYVRAKHVQLIEKDPSRAISLFWAAINSGDRVDSALKDMAVVMKQLNRSEEAIEAIKSFRHLCPHESQESLDNVLVELYKRSGRIEEQIEILQVKLKEIEEGLAFGGKRTKVARSQGKKVQIRIEQEYSRLLGNLAWAYLQQKDYKLAEQNYRKALCFEVDRNKQCNLAICLMHMNRTAEAKFLLQTIKASPENGQMDESYARSFERAIQMLKEVESKRDVKSIVHEEGSCAEIRTPLSQARYRSPVQFSTPIHGGKNLMSDYGLPRRLANEHSEETVQSDEWNRGHCENKTFFGCSVERNLKFTSFGVGNGSHSSPQILFDDELKRRTYVESPQARISDFCGQGKGKWNSSLCKRAYATPINGGTPKIPFTKPRRCSWGLSNGDQKSKWGTNDTAVGCNRKLSFEPPVFSNHEQFLSYQKLKGKFPPLSYDMRQNTLKKSDSHLESGSGHWRKRSCGNHAESNLTMRSSSYGNSDKSSNNTKADCETLSEIVQSLEELQEPTHDSQTKSQSHSSLGGDMEVTQNFSRSNSKKSWADMVEEDEQDFLCGRLDYSKSDVIYPSQELSVSVLTPGKCPAGWNMGDEFTDENRNSNIIQETPTLLNHIDNLSQKIGSLDLQDGYYTQTQNDDSATNRAVRRSLCFDQNQKPDTEERDCLSSGDGIKLLRRTRLQVFKDITELSEGPRQ